MQGLGDLKAGVVVPDKLDVGLGQILADDLPPLVAAGVVPLAVNDGHAGLLAEAALRRESVRLGESLGPGGGPLIHSPHQDPVHGPVGGQHLDEGGGPEPAVDVEGLVVVRLAPGHLHIRRYIHWQPVGTGAARFFRPRRRILQTRNRMEMGRRQDGSG